MIPAPLVDTQVAAMVCGYGDQVSYGELVQSVCKVSLDKSSRFTDWARRPLSEAQLTYAAADVTYLRDVYRMLSRGSRRPGRETWLARRDGGPKLALRPTSSIPTKLGSASNRCASRAISAC